MTVASDTSSALVIASASDEATAQKSAYILAERVFCIVRFTKPSSSKQRMHFLVGDSKIQKMFPLA